MLNTRRVSAEPPRGFLRGAAWCSLAGMLIAGLLGLGLAGCKKSTANASISPNGPEVADNASAGQVLQAYRPFLVVVDTSWQESTSLLAGWQPRGQAGTGIIVASDGQQALVLTSRRAVDPRFGRADPPRMQNVSFRVANPAQRTAGQYAYARLVAVYMNQGNLALLRMTSAAPEPFTVPLANAAALRAGEKVYVIGLPAAQGFAISEGIINNFWQDNGSNGRTIQISVPLTPPNAVGPVLTQKTGKLAGMMCGLEATGSPMVGTATPADRLTNPNYWDYLFDETPTRKLLEMLR